jgi:hypothetical protein
MRPLTTTTTVPKHPPSPARIFNEVQLYMSVIFKLHFAGARTHTRACMCSDSTHMHILLPTHPPRLQPTPQPFPRTCARTCRACIYATSNRHYSSPTVPPFPCTCMVHMRTDVYVPIYMCPYMCPMPEAAASSTSNQPPAALELRPRGGVPRGDAAVRVWVWVGGGESAHLFDAVESVVVGHLVEAQLAAALSRGARRGERRERQPFGVRPLVPHRVAGRRSLGWATYAAKISRRASCWPGAQRLARSWSQSRCLRGGLPIPRPPPPRPRPPRPPRAPPPRPSATTVRGPARGAGRSGAKASWAHPDGPRCTKARLPVDTIVVQA